MQVAIALLCGIVFGAGLAVSGMTNPAKVLAFLDVAGAWDPTLACVMGAALATTAAGFALAGRRSRPWLAATFSIPTRRDLDARLVGGAAIFGVGWGLVGLCPGPALANLARGSTEIWIFAGAMLAGVVAYRWVDATGGTPAASPTRAPAAGPG
jgi:uncharacterized membrane protein YedE/YeeE